MLAVRVEEVFGDSRIDVNILCAAVRIFSHECCFRHPLELLA